MEGPLDSRLCDPFGGDGFIDDTAPERVILRRGLCVRARGMSMKVWRSFGAGLY
jgi:hypothetical protein